MGYLILLGSVLLAGMLGVKVGELAGRISGSTFVASLTSCLLYSGLLLAGCCLLYQSIPQPPQGVDPHPRPCPDRQASHQPRRFLSSGWRQPLHAGSDCSTTPITTIGFGNVHVAMTNGFRPTEFKSTEKQNVIMLA